MRDLWEIESLMRAGVKLDCTGRPETPERLALAQANAQAWIDSQYRQELRASTERQIAANRDSRKSALWYCMLHGES